MIPEWVMVIVVGTLGPAIGICFGKWMYWRNQTAYYKHMEEVWYRYYCEEGNKVQALLEEVGRG